MESWTRAVRVLVAVLIAVVDEYGQRRKSSSHR
jgi:hypothetical protein